MTKLKELLGAVYVDVDHCTLDELKYAVKLITEVQKLGRVERSLILDCYNNGPLAVIQGACRDNMNGLVESGYVVPVVVKGAHGCWGCTRKGADAYWVIMADGT